MASLRKRKVIYSDRFIPCRTSSRLQLFSVMEKSSPAAKEGRRSEQYLRLLRAELFGTESLPLSPSFGEESPMSPSKNIFRYKVDPSFPIRSPFSAIVAVDYEGEAAKCSMSPKPTRKIPMKPDRILDAPSIEDDFYLNLVDWSSQNVVAVGLGACVYLWSASTKKAMKLCDLGTRNSVCAVQWTLEGSYLAIGTNLGNIQGRNGFWEL